ncbi:MAG: DHH family phosphoesterase [Ruminococcus sp.]|nr:DHH family phosphoesterase [Ruminococcus sp.]
MKGLKTFDLIIKVTTGVIALVSLISSFFVFDAPLTTGRGKVLLAISVIFTLLFIIECIVFKGRMQKEVSKLAGQIGKTERESLLHFPAPVIIIDERATVIWYNRRFGSQVYTDGEAYGINILDVVEMDLGKVFSPEGDLVCLKNRFYQTRGIHTDATGQLSMIYFNDTTDFVELEYEHKESHKNVIIVSVDNYEELMINARESDKAHVLVQIEKLIENFTEGTTAFYKKVSSDKFYVIMEDRHLKPIIERRFPILEQARQITVDDKQNLTLSIGVGAHAENLAESEHYARQALDMCLGRGGDQAAVRRDSSNFEFFGGVSKGIEKSTKVKSRMIAKSMLDFMQQAEKILVMGHRFSDLDAVGAAVGMCSAARKMGRESYVVVNREQSLAKLLINYLDENDINNYFISPADGIEKMNENTMLIVVDTHNPDLVESKEVLARAQNVIVIDHHRMMNKSIDNAVMFYQEPTASSACEMVAELIEYFGISSKIPSPVAEAMLAGIMLDTKDFVMKTGVRTFEAAAFLKKLGADTINVKRLFANSIETYQYKSHIINNAQIYRKCAIACADVVFDNIRVASSQAADDLLGIVGVNASFVLYEQNGIVNISGRSLGAFNVQIVMEALGGGGHLTMAATQIKTDLNTAGRMLKEAIDEYIRNNKV